MDDSPYYTTKEAAVYLKTTVGALLQQVNRGHLVPDSWAQRNRFRGHRFLRSTLDKFMGIAVTSEDGKDNTELDRRREEVGTRQVPRTRYLD